MTSVDDLLQHKAPAERRLEVRLDPDGEKIVVMRFRAVGRRAWDKLIEAYPRTDEQQQTYVTEQLRRGVPPSQLLELRWNHDTFPPAAISACLIEPEMTYEQAAELWDSDKWSTDELTKIMAACIAVNETSGTAEWGKGSAATPDSGTSSPRAATTGSRTVNGKGGRTTTKTRRSRT